MLKALQKKQANRCHYWRCFPIALVSLLCFHLAFAGTSDLQIPGIPLYHPQQSTDKVQYNYTLIDAAHQQKIQQQSQQDIRQIIAALNQIKTSKLSKQQQQQASIKLIIDSFQHRPYIGYGAEGEGTWNNKGNKQHIKQDPIYRTDGFDCATFVQTVLALFNSSSFDDFKKTIIKVQYGAAGLAQDDAVHYCNRNNFTSKDFNRINQQQGYLTDVTHSASIPLKAKKITTTIDPIKWLNKQSQGVMAQRYNIRVLKQADGPAMVKRFTENYAQRYCPKLKPERVTLHYLPKQALTTAVNTSKGMMYKPNHAVINKIPTPSIVEFVRDDKKWTVNGVPIKQKLDTGILVSHVGILHEEVFKKNQLIYRQTTCNIHKGVPRCLVTPVYCRKKQCKRIMFTHATDAFPNNYYYYKQNNQYYCTGQKPSKGTPYTYCNRVTSLPLGDYLTQKQYGRYLYMMAPSILGINIQKIN